jgi:hypothetical protein
MGSPALLMIEAFLALVSADKSNEFNAPVQVEQGLSSKVRESSNQIAKINSLIAALPAVIKMDEVPF